MENFFSPCGAYVLSLATYSSMYYDIAYMSATYNPKKKKRARTHGFLARTSSHTGRAVLKRRRTKGRKRLTVSS